MLLARPNLHSSLNVLSTAQCVLFLVPWQNPRLIVLQSNGANLKAPFLYPQSKGLTERDLASLGYNDTIIFRPGLLADTQRNDPRFAESAFGCVYR